MSERWGMDIGQAGRLKRQGRLKTTRAPIDHALLSSAPCRHTHTAPAPPALSLSISLLPFIHTYVSWMRVATEHSIWAMHRATRRPFATGSVKGVASDFRPAKGPALAGGAGSGMADAPPPAAAARIGAKAGRRAGRAARRAGARVTDDDESRGAKDARGGAAARSIMWACIFSETGPRARNARAREWVECVWRRTGTRGTGEK